MRQRKLTIKKNHFVVYNWCIVLDMIRGGANVVERREPII